MREFEQMEMQFFIAPELNWSGLKMERSSFEVASCLGTTFQVAV
jgi:glycyl-tRNA synthetase (class II)